MDNPDRAYLLDDLEAVTQALAGGVRAALERHRQAQTPVIGWRDGEVVEVPPEAISHLIAERFPRTEAVPSDETSTQPK